MPRLSVNTLRTSLAALALSFAVMAHGAEKEKPASLIGLTKDQVYNRLGDPRSQMKAGPREVMIFPKVKVTFRNGIVSETEEIFEEPPPKPPAPAPVPAAAQPPPETPAATPAPVAPTNPDLPTAAAARAAAAAATSPEAKPAPAADENAPLAIKLVRPPSAGGPRPVTKAPTTPVATTPEAGPASAPAPAPKSAAQAVVVAPSNVPAPAPVSVPAPSPALVAPTREVTTTAPVVPPAMTPEQAAAAAVPVGTAPETKPVTPGETTDADAAAAKDATEAPKKKAPPKRFFRRHVDPDSELPEVTLFTTQTYVFGLALIGAVGYLIWRGRQRKLELDATTVSNTPFEETTAMGASTGAMFTADLLAKLEWKRFEELIAQYYIKTGVVAVRTKTGPTSPVHLKISWKGEAKPFACVQCHASPTGLIRLGPLQDLLAALTIDDIRRGYVVTNGKFNVEARDFAEEKHFTLLPGELLLEKLNALPAAARAELMQEITAGDYTTPTCPKCDVKMTRGDDGNWRCTKCEAKIPGMIG